MAIIKVGTEMYECLLVLLEPEHEFFISRDAGCLDRSSDYLPMASAEYQDAYFGKLKGAVMTRDEFDAFCRKWESECERMNQCEELDSWMCEYEDTQACIEEDREFGAEWVFVVSPAKPSSMVFTVNDLYRTSQSYGVPFELRQYTQEARVSRALYDSVIIPEENLLEWYGPTVVCFWDSFNDEAYNKVFIRKEAPDLLSANAADGRLVAFIDWTVDLAKLRKSRSLSKRRYDQNNSKGMFLKLNSKTDADIIEWMEKCENKQGVIKELIRKAMRENQQ